MDLVWTCQCCGKEYRSLPFAYALDEPDPWRALPEAERRLRATLTSDRCIIDRKEFCIRARLEIPVIGSDAPFIWGLWVSVSKEAYDRIGALWNTEIRDREPPIPGTLCSDLPIYPRTSGLMCHLHLRNAGRRPSVKLEPADHPLAAEQRNGITLERVKEIAAAVQQHSK